MMKRPVKYFLNDKEISEDKYYTGQRTPASPSHGKYTATDEGGSNTYYYLNDNRVSEQKWKRYCSKLGQYFYAFEGMPIE